MIWETWQATLEPLRAELNRLLGETWEEWQIPREAKAGWPEPATAAHAAWWEARIARQKEIDASIARNAEIELLYDRPYEKKGVVRVTGPFTVESLSPHRVLPADEDDPWLGVGEDGADEDGEESPHPNPPPLRRERGLRGGAGPARAMVGPAGKPRRPGDGGQGDDFVRVVLENLKAAGVQNTKKGERLELVELRPWPGEWIAAEGRYLEAGVERRAAVCIGPEFGTVGQELVRAAAKEAVTYFDTLVVCGFAFEAQVGQETQKLGKLTVLKARMSQELHMGDALKKTGAGNLFVVFGEPDLELRPAGDGKWEVEIRGVDIFDPTTGEIRSSQDPAQDIACWLVDTDYDEESFFVRHAYFLNGRAHDPYAALKRTLKAEVDEEAWASLYRTVSRPFAAPASGRIAVKVINHYGDEVMKVYRVPPRQ